MLDWKPVMVSGVDIEAKTEVGTYTISFDSPTAGGASNLWLAGAEVDDFLVFQKRSDAIWLAEEDYRERRANLEREGYAD